MEAVRGGHWSGDIAVDDVTIMAGNCPEVRGYCLFLFVYKIIYCILLIAFWMPGSKDTQGNYRRSSKQLYNVSLYSKVRSPPYCCVVLSDLRLCLIPN